MILKIAVENHKVQKSLIGLGGMAAGSLTVSKGVALTPDIRELRGGLERAKKEWAAAKGQAFVRDSVNGGSLYDQLDSLTNRHKKGVLDPISNKLSSFKKKRALLMAAGAGAIGLGGYLYSRGIKK